MRKCANINPCNSTRKNVKIYIGSFFSVVLQVKLLFLSESTAYPIQVVTHNLLESSKEYNLIQGH
jgi:hypothetical protein